MVAPGAFVVADGMGGHNAGDVASRLTIEAVQAWLSTGKPDIAAVPAVVQLANEVVRTQSGEEGRGGMGSTLVAAFVVGNADDDSVVVVNVGDSRCYALDDGLLRQVTKDHSHVQELVDAGAIRADEAGTHPERNVVTRAIGVEAAVAGDYFILPRTPRTRLLLCSDGVSNELAPMQLIDILTRSTDPVDAAEQIVAAVMDGDATDNATAVVVDIEHEMATVDDDTTQHIEITGPRAWPPPTADSSPAPPPPPPPPPPPEPPQPPATSVVVAEVEAPHRLTDEPEMLIDAVPSTLGRELPPPVVPVQFIDAVPNE